jgi:hypothetical protein
MSPPIFCPRSRRSPFPDNPFSGGLNGTFCIPGVIRLPLPGPTPGTPAPFRDVFAKYTIGPV